MWIFTRSTTNTENNTCLEFEDWQNSVLDRFHACAFIATSASKWKTLICHRVSQIQEMGTGYEWRHIASASNPADLILRDTNLETLKNCGLWWVGPKWLHQHPVLCPTTQLIKHPEPTLECEVTLVKVMIQCFPTEFIIMFTTWSRLERTAVYCLRLLTVQETLLQERPVILPAQNEEMNWTHALR